MGIREYPGVSGWTGYIQSTILEPKGLALGEDYVQANLCLPIQGVHLWKEATIFMVSLIVVISVLESHMELTNLKMKQHGNSRRW